MSRLFRRFARWLTRLMLRAGILPASAKADTDTMGEYKRLLSEKDDPKPGLVLPDPNAPYAELIRRVRLYAQNGAKALAPLLDSMALRYGEPDPPDEAWLIATLAQIEHDADDPEAHTICAQIRAIGLEGATAICAAYNAPTTIIDGEVYEFESEKRRRVVQ